MFRLIAKFDIQLPGGGLLVYRPRTDVLQYTISVNGFDVELCLNPTFETWRNLFSHDKNALIEDPYWSISTIRISVAREEDVPPPPPQTVDSITSYDERRRYLEERKPAYREVAAQVLNRAVERQNRHLVRALKTLTPLTTIIYVSYFNAATKLPIAASHCTETIRGNHTKLTLTR
jgi:hypothetical protein